MEVQAMQGYFDGGFFYQHGRRVSLPERRLVIVNVLDVPVDTEETKKSDIEFWKEFDRLAAESADENHLLLNEAFTRDRSSRTTIIFNDEGKV